MTALESQGSKPLRTRGRDRQGQGCGWGQEGPSPPPLSPISTPSPQGFRSLGPRWVVNPCQGQRAGCKEPADSRPVLCSCFSPGSRALPRSEGPTATGGGGGGAGQCPLCASVTRPQVPWGHEPVSSHRLPPSLGPPAASRCSANSSGQGVGSRNWTFPGRPDCEEEEGHFSFRLQQDDSLTLHDTRRGQQGDRLHFPAGKLSLSGDSRVARVECQLRSVQCSFPQRRCPAGTPGPPGRWGLGAPRPPSEHGHRPRCRAGGPPQRPPQQAPGPFGPRPCMPQITTRKQRQPRSWDSRGRASRHYSLDKGPE